MAIGDRKPDNVEYTGATSNGCKWGKDGNLYNKYGFRIESLKEKRERQRAEEAAEEARRAEYVSSGMDPLSAMYEDLEERAYNAVANGCKKVAMGTLKGAAMLGTGIYRLAKNRKQKDMSEN